MAVELLVNFVVPVSRTCIVNDQNNSYRYLLCFEQAKRFGTDLLIIVFQYFLVTSLIKKCKDDLVRYNYSFIGRKFGDSCKLAFQKVEMSHALRSLSRAHHAYITFNIILLAQNCEICYRSFCLTTVILL